MNAGDQFLTADEMSAVRQAGDLWGTLCKVAGNGPTRDNDLHELIVHVHAIQQAVMSQAAGRAYPGTYRLLGETLRTEDAES